MTVKGPNAAFDPHAIPATKIFVPDTATTELKAGLLECGLGIEPGVYHPDECLIDR